MPSTDERWRSGPGLLASVWRYKYLVGVFVTLAAAGAFFLSSSQAPVYEATARLFLADPRTSSVFGQGRSVDADRYVPQQAERVTSRPVLDATSELLGGEFSRNDLSRRVDAAGDVELDMLEITASASSPDRAADVANAASTAYMQVSRDARLSSAQAAATELDLATDELDDQIEALQARIAGAVSSSTVDILREQLDVLVRQRVEIRARSQQLLVDARVFGSGVDLVEAAEPPRDASSPNPVRDTALAIILAGGLAAAAAYWLAGRSRKVESPSQVAEILGIRHVATVPLYRRAREDTLSDRATLEVPHQEAFNFLLSSVEHLLRTKDRRSVLITSSQPGDGKTEVSLQLALSAQLESRKSALVDGDLHVRELTRLANMDGAPGLTDLATTGARGASQFLSRLDILGGQLRLPFLAAGAAGRDSAGRLRDPGVVQGLQRIASQHEFVFVDSAPLLATADTTVLAGYVDAVLLVIRDGVDLDTLIALRERLRFVAGDILGFVWIGSGSTATLGYAYGVDAYGERNRRAAKPVIAYPDLDEDESTTDPSAGPGVARPLKPLSAPSRPTSPGEEPTATSTTPDPAPSAQVGRPDSPDLPGGLNALWSSQDPR